MVLLNKQLYLTWLNQAITLVNHAIISVCFIQKSHLQHIVFVVEQLLSVSFSVSLCIQRACKGFSLALSQPLALWNRLGSYTTEILHFFSSACHYFCWRSISGLKSVSENPQHATTPWIFDLAVQQAVWRCSLSDVLQTFCVGDLVSEIQTLYIFFFFPSVSLSSSPSACLSPASRSCFQTASVWSLNFEDVSPVPTVQRLTCLTLFLIFILFLLAEAWMQLFTTTASHHSWPHSSQCVFPPSPSLSLYLLLYSERFFVRLNKSGLPKSPEKTERQCTLFVVSGAVV